VALNVSCNVHELAHALVGSALGWEVERVNLCLAGGGSVQYSSVGLWAGNTQGYAGGFVAAAFLAGMYYLVFARSSRPLRGPAWWGAGLGVVLCIGPQIVLGFLEGTRGPGEDYTTLIASAPVRYGTILILSMLAGAAVYVWRWRPDGGAPTL
jgi:biotin transporter BioY